MAGASTAFKQTHVPVLRESVLEYLNPRRGGKYIDGTVGAGGHARAIAEACSPDGRVLGLDADPRALEVASANLADLGDRVTLRHANFSHLARVAAEAQFMPADGVLLDLGLSSMQLADEQRGFSFMAGGPLDMRFDPTTGPTAAELANSLSESDLANLIFEYGEEHASRRIARAIVKARPIVSAVHLAEIIENALGRHGRIHPATRTFQALRIEVNRELTVLDQVLAQIPDVLGIGGRAVIITFHSLEDRIVKNSFRSESRYRVLTKHPIRPTREEALANPRSRSAKLRAVERIS